MRHNVGYTPMPPSIPTTTLKSFIIGDSTCKTLKNRDLQRHIDNNNEKAFISYHPNAEAEQIRHYSKFQLEHNKPDNIIILAGTNDILHHPSMTTQNEYMGPPIDPAEIAEKLMRIGSEAKEAGVKRVCVSTLIRPTFDKGRFEVEKVNTYIRQLSSREGFVMIEQSNIGRADMGDAIHVNWKTGTDKLMQNVFSQLHTYKGPQQNYRRDRDRG